MFLSFKNLFRNFPDELSALVTTTFRDDNDYIAASRCCQQPQTARISLIVQVAHFAHGSLDMITIQRPTEALIYAEANACKSRRR